MGGKTATTTQQVSIPQDVLDRYNEANAMAAQAAQTPFQTYSTDPSAFVAPLNEQQLAGISTINQASGAYQPYFDQAGAALGMGLQSAQPGELQINQFMNPFQQSVIDATMAQMAQQQEQQQSGALGTAVSSGAFGGDRAGIAAANLANQQALATGSTLAGLNAENYNQALAAAQQQQQLALTAEQADLARYMQGAGMYAGLGQGVQQAGLAGGEAMLNAGTLGQQTEQAGLSALYNQFLQQMAYPFQVAQFLSNIAMGTGALSGSTTTTAQPVPFFSDRRLKEDIRKIGATDDGLPIYKFKYKGDDSEQTHIGFMADEVEKKKPEAVGVAPNGYKTVDYDRATRAAGGVVGPYSAAVGSQPGMASYIPEAFLPVGDLMIADTSIPDMSAQTLGGQMEAAARFGENISGLRDTYGDLRRWMDARADEQGSVSPGLPSRGGRARGGLVPAYAYGGSAEYLKAGMEKNPVQAKGYLADTVEEQEEGKRAMMKPASAPGQPQSVVGQIGEAANTIAAIMALSDRRAKEGIRRIGRTDDGLPIYSFRYKGDNAEQTHVGFMADEVEKRHPEAVSTGSDGLKRVDLSQADKFYRGGGVRPAYQTGGTPTLDELEREIAGRTVRDDIFPMERPAALTPTFGGSNPAYPPREENVTRATGNTAIPATEQGIPLVNYDAANLLPPIVGGVAPAPAAEAAPMRPMGRPTDLAPETAMLPPARPAGLVPAPVAPGRPMARPDGLAAGTPAPSAEAGVAPAAAGLAPVAETQPGRRIYAGEHADYARQMAAQYEIPEDIFLRLIGTESSGNQNAVSPRGALGLTQLMPGTAEELGVDPTDPLQNIEGGARYLKQMYDRFGSWDLALAAYNAGPGRVSEYGGIPPFEETQNYVASILGGEPAGTATSQSAPTTGGVAPAGDQVRREEQPAQDGFMGRMMYVRDPETGERRVNPDFVMSVLSGLGTMASSPSLFLGSAALQGLGGFANTYTGLQRLRPEIARTEAEAGLIRSQQRAADIAASTSSFFQVGNNGAIMFLADPRNPASAVPLSVFLDNPQAFSTGNPQLDRMLLEEAQRRAQSVEGTVFSLPDVQDAIDRDNRLVTTNPALREQSNETARLAEGAAEAARAFKPTSVMQANAVANLVSGDASIRTGAFGELQTQAYRYANALLGLAGEAPITGVDDAQIMSKISTLQAVMASQGAGQESFNALAQILQTAPNAELEPQTNAALMAALLVDQQRAIDLGEFTRDYMTAPGNSMGVTLGAAETFNDIYGRRMIAEKKALESLIYNGGEYFPMILDPATTTAERNYIIRGVLMANGMTEDQLAAISDVNGNIDLARYFGG